MNTPEIRQQIDQYLEQLSCDRLQLVADFLAYLADKESDEARLFSPLNPPILGDFEIPVPPKLDTNGEIFRNFVRLLKAP